MSRTPIWSDDEKQIARDYFPDINKIMELTGRARRGVKYKLWELGFRKPHHAEGYLRTFRAPEKLPIEQLKTGRCPRCGKRLWQEKAQSAEGYTTDCCDLVDEAGHRWPLPRGVITLWPRLKSVGKEGG